MASTKSSIANIGEILGLKPTEFTFLNPPLIDAPNSQITDLSGNVRKLADPSKTLRPAMGVERIHCNNLTFIDNEKGPNGELVYKVANEDRIRFVGNWILNSGTSGVSPGTITSETANYVEVVFYGTGLNLISLIHAGALDWRISVDGGVESANFLPSQSTILSARNYTANVVIPLVKGLTLGIHTVKIRKNDTISGFAVPGIEILNEAAEIKTPQGEVLAFGRKYTNPSLDSSSYNSGFDGNPILNGRGGRVIEYITPEGQIGKALQQTDASTQTLALASHVNEEVIKRVNFREFGASRADDFSTLLGSSDRAFVLNDGTTTLTCNDMSTNAFAITGDAVQFNTTGSYITITFVGTGLDVSRAANGNGTGDTISVDIDGVNIGNLDSIVSTSRRIEKIASGLPYGTHTVRLTATAAVGFDIGVYDFIVYGPKKPSIPSNAVQIGEYYLVSNFSAAGVAGVAFTDNMDNYQGVISKMGTREITYVGTWIAPTLDATFMMPAGFYPNTTTNTSYAEYTFFGTGVGIHFIDSAGGTVTYTINVDGVANATGANLLSVTNNGAGSYTTNTAVGGRPARLTFTGLTLGVHTIRITRTGGSGGMAPIRWDVITPVHFPDFRVGSLSLSPAVQLKEEANNNIDLSKAKAWLTLDATNDIVLASMGIASVLHVATGEFHVYLQRNMKPGYLALTSATKQSGNAAANSSFAELGAISQFGGTKIIVTAVNGSATYNPGRLFLAVFGEYIDEE